jgi:hypothetical protein
VTREVWPARHRFFVENPLRVGDTVTSTRWRISLPPCCAWRLAPPSPCSTATATNISPRVTTLTRATPPVKSSPCAPPPPTRAFISRSTQCTLKQDKFDWVLQKGTELGVSCFVPVVSERSVVRPAAALASKRARWLTILREATEQCGRTRPPELAAAVELDAVTLPAGVHGFYRLGRGCRVAGVG